MNKRRGEDDMTAPGASAPGEELSPFAQTQETKEILVSGAEWAQMMASLVYDCQHLLIALLADRCPDGSKVAPSAAARVLSSLGANPAAIANQLIGEAPTAAPLAEAPLISEAMGEVLERAVDLAQLDSRISSEVEPPHLLMALLALSPSPLSALRRLRETDVTAETVAAAWRQLPEEEDSSEVAGLGASLSGMASDLTAKARAGLLDPVIGREEEIDRIITVLCRRNKNNACLIGEAGTGKTAIVEGLAQRIANGNVPRRLREARILVLDVSRLVAGTILRGSFEDKLNHFLDELRATPGTILFIDELHTIVGAGGAGGDDTNDLGNFLKPFLARGEVSVIGATTREEYRRFIERDAALERRFQAIEVDEPDALATRAILEGIAPIYARHHGVSYSSEILDVCVSLASRHLPSRHFPDKAIDLLDEAGAQAAKTDAAAVRLEDVTAALPRVKSGLSHEAAKRRGLAGNLAESLIGQRSAIELISETIEAAQLAISERNAPLAAMLLVGPSACGKSAAARAIAEALFDGALTVLDMTEYTEPSTISSLLGAPPGYVGFEQRARLIEPIRHKPQQVVLIKHLDAAAPQVRAVFADILSAGSLRDYHERLASFREAVLIFTVTTESRPGGSLGFHVANLAAPAAEVNESERGGLRSLLGGNIVDVVDEIIRFAPLDAAALRAAADRRLSALIEGLRHRGVEVALDRELVEHLVYVVGKAGGLRDLERYVSRLVERPIAIALVGAPGASAIRVSLREGKGVAQVDQGAAVPVLVPARRSAPKARK